MCWAPCGTDPFRVSLRVRLRAPVSLLVVVTALAAALAFPLAQQAPSEPRPTDPTYCERLAAAASKRAGIVTGEGRTVLVVGDSWSAGWGLPDPAGAWATGLPGRVFVDGFPGSGYSADASRCGAVSYADRVEAAVQRSAPDLVVVQGGLNDADRSDAEIAEGFDRVITSLASYDVVVVGPARAPSRHRAVPRVHRLLERLCAERAVPYVGTTDLELPYLEDRLHLTLEGHRLFGQAVAGRIAALS